jgi:hypothetical protein
LTPAWITLPESSTRHEAGSVGLMLKLMLVAVADDALILRRRRR